MAKRSVRRKTPAQKNRERAARVAYGLLIDDWIAADPEHRSQAAMARDLGVSDFAVHTWRLGNYSPSGAYPEAIDTYTDGAVPAKACPSRRLLRAVTKFTASKRA